MALDLEELKELESRLIGYQLGPGSAKRHEAIKQFLNGGASFIAVPAYRDAHRAIGRLGNKASPGTVASALKDKLKIHQLSTLQDKHSWITEDKAIADAKNLAARAQRLALERAGKRYVQALEQGEDIDAAWGGLERAKGEAQSLSPNRLLDNIVSAQTLAAKDFAPIRWAVPGILPEGANILGGRPKIGKSYLGMNLSAAVSSGGYAFGSIKVDPGPALYLGLEDSERRLKSRLEQVMRGAPIPEGLDFVGVGGWRRLDQGGLEGIRAWLIQHPDARLVVVDTLARIRQRKTRGDRLYDDDYEAIQGLQELGLRHRVAILILHHLRKMAAEDFVDELSGTEGLGGAADSILVLKRARRSQEGELHITGRDLPEEKELAVTWDQELTSWRISGDAEEVRLSETRREVVDLFKADPTPRTPTEAAPLLGKSLPATKKLFWEMKKAETLTTDGKGKYSLREKPIEVGNYSNQGSSCNSGNRGNPDLPF